MTQSTLRRDRDFLMSCRRIIKSMDADKSIKVSDVSAAAAAGGVTGYYMTYDYACA